jgi:hypothetical protein
MKRIDSSIIALAANEADTFSLQIPVITDQFSLLGMDGWRNRALSYAQQYFAITRAFCKMTRTTFGGEVQLWDIFRLKS